MPKLSTEILTLLKEKSTLKQKVFDQTFTQFNLIKEILHETATHYNKELQGIDERVKLEYTDAGQFAAKLRVAGDMLVFNMMTNSFLFDREHEVWKSDYCKTKETNAICGVINIYNFLNDSFNYNRTEDPGYLIARIFVNAEGHFFVEGKRQRGVGANSFGKSEVSKEKLNRFIETAIYYALNFDLLVSPYDAIKIISLAQMNEEILLTRAKTGKRLGFKYNADDV